MGRNNGPDLSNLVHRDRESILRDIKEPSASINPDYVHQVVTLKDGRVLAGFLKREKDDTVAVDSKGRQTVFRGDQIESIQPESISTMPADLDRTIGPEGMEDLLIFLRADPARHGKPAQP